jgi:hypothetical protein
LHQQQKRVKSVWLKGYRGSLARKESLPRVQPVGAKREYTLTGPDGRQRTNIFIFSSGFRKDLLNSEG